MHVRVQDRGILQMCLLTPPRAQPGKVQKGLYGYSSSICIYKPSHRGGVSVPSCAQGRSVYGGADADAKSLQWQRVVLGRGERRFSTGISTSSMLLT